MRLPLTWLLTLSIQLLSSSVHAISGDLELSSLAQQGKHHELIEALEPSIRGGEDVSSFQLMMLGGAYYEVGKYRQALATVERLEKRLQAGDSSAFGADLSVYPAIIRAAVALDQGLLEEAIRQANIAAGNLKPNQPFYRSQLIMTGGTLGVAQALAGADSEARQQLERIRAVNLDTSNLGPEKYTAMARIQIALKDFPSALASISDPGAALSPTLTAFYDPTFQNLPRFFMRCKSLLETGRGSEAKLGYDELLKHPQINQYGTLYWVVLYDRARIAITENDLPAAIDLLQRAIEVIEQRRSSISTEAGRIGFVGDKQAVYGQLVSLLLRQGLDRQAFDVAERAKSRALVDLLASKSEFAIRDTDPGQVRRVLSEIDALDQATQQKQANPVGPDTPEIRSLAVARQQLAATWPRLASLVSVGITPIGQVATMLSAEESLVEYYYSGTDLHAFVLKNGKLLAVTLDKGRIETEIQALRNAIGLADSDKWQSHAERLYQHLWQPIDKILSGTSRIIIVPHGALHYLPFSVLRGADGKMLVERYGLSVLPSASVLQFLSPMPTDSTTSMLVLGNPDLGNPALDLKFAGEEATVVSHFYPDSRLLLRRDASETNLRKDGRRFRRLHIASHGSFQAEAPLDSGLHLAKDGENDGVLTVGELYGMDLDAELVTLSACETGLGKIASGDDVVGLGRGFLYAGARAIVSSLWSVDDKATGELMRAFYRNLVQHDKVEALRQAQLSTRAQFPHPFFWAAFQLTGRAN